MGAPSSAAADPVEVFEGELIDGSDQGDQGPAIVEAILSVWPDDRDRAATAEVAARVSVLGGEYAGWVAADVTRALRAVGVEPRTLKVAGRAARGVYLADLQAVGGRGGG